MDAEKIVTMLRNCASIDGSGCGGCDDAALDNGTLNCADNLKILAADLIENQQREIEALRQANSALREKQQWISATERLPRNYEPVVVIVSGNPRKNIQLISAIELATFCDDGWCLEMYPEWMDANVTHCMPLPEAPEVD